MAFTGPVSRRGEEVSMSQFKFVSYAKVKSIYWIRSLKVHEIGSTERVFDDLMPYLFSKQIPIAVRDVETADELRAALDEVLEFAKAGGAPVLHFDTHGEKADGIFIASSQECVGWPEIATRLREINVAMGNNLIVVSAACSSFHLVFQNDINKPVMFYIMIGPPEPISFGYVEAAMFKFYEHLFDIGDITEAYDKYLAPDMKLLHCERLLTIVMARYFNDNCMGSGLQRRVEKVITDAITIYGKPNTPPNLKLMRSLARQQFKPSAEVFDRWAKKFLIGKTPGVTFEQVLDLVRKGKIRNQLRKKR